MDKSNTLPEEAAVQQESVQNETVEDNKSVSTSEFNHLAMALCKAQSIITHPIKDNKAGAGSFSYTYADLPSVIDAVRKAFSPNGLSFTQFPSVDVANKTVNVLTMIMHESGQTLESNLTMGINDLKPQSIGSAITYARRYSLSAMAGIAAEQDDDANTAQGNTEVKLTRRRKL